MGLNSVNTNAGALIALENLNTTQQALQATQTRINTGLKIGSAKDNGAIWAIAETERAQISSLDAATNSLSNAKSILDTTLAVGAQLSELLNNLRTKALAAADLGVDDNSR